MTNTAKLKVLMVFNGRTPPFPPAYNLAQVFDDCGVDFTFVNLAADRDRHDRLLGHGRWISLRAAPSFVPFAHVRYPIAFLTFFLRLRRLARTLAPDVLLGTWGGGYLLARLMRWSGIRARVVFWAQEYIRHDELPRANPLRSIVSIERRLAAGADLTVAADPIRGRYQCEYLGAPHWIAIRNVPSRQPLPDGPSPLGACLSAIRAERPSDRLFVFVGSICRGALVPELVESFAQWPADTQLVFAGKVDPDVQDFPSRIAAHRGRIHYLPPMPYDQLLRGLPLADAGIAFYSVDQPWMNERYCAPCKVGDYLKAGLPMLLSFNETLEFLVREFPIGVTVNPRAPAAIAGGVRELIERIRSGGVSRDGVRSAFETRLCLEKQCEPLLRQFDGWRAGSTGPCGMPNDDHDPGIAAR